MKKSTLLFSFILLFACKQQYVENIKTEKDQIDGSVRIQDTISEVEFYMDAYFNTHKIVPLAIALNKNNESEITLVNHKIKWIDNGDMNAIRIGGKLIDLETKITLNPVWGTDSDSIKFINNWDEMKYYQYKGNEYIGIGMHFTPCTGLGCSVHYFLVYDLKNKTENYFGAFRTDDELHLYAFNNNAQIDFLSKTLDWNGGSEMNFITELYSVNKNGYFVKQTDSIGKPFQICITTYPNDTTMTQFKTHSHWFEEIQK